MGPMIRLMLIVVILCVAPAGVAQTGEEDAPTMSQFFVGLIYRGPTWSPEVTEAVIEVQAAHLANIDRLVATGKMAMAGPFGDNGDLRGLFFFSVATLEEAQELVDTDPAVKNGRLRVELRPWWGPASLATLLQSSDAETP